MKRLFFLWFLACCLCLNGPLAWGDGYIPQVQVLPEEIVGVVVYPDGVTPVVKLPVRVWNIERSRMVYRTETNEDGQFRIPSMVKEGQCYLFVGKLRIDLEIMRRNKALVSQRHDLVIVVPRWMTVTTGIRVYDVLLASVLMQAPSLPRVVSP